MTAALAIYGRTYLDVEVDVPIDELAHGKGKVDVEVRPLLGGFPCNAVRALVGRLPPEQVTLVTRIGAIDLPRLYHAVPPGTVIHAVTDDSLDWPPVTVIVNPARECRLLRTGRPGDLSAAELGTLPRAQVHVFGRVDPSLPADVRRHEPDAVLAWCAGASAPLDVIDVCDLACVNTAEARSLLGSEATTRDLALALAARVARPCVRVVTGRGDAPTVAAVRTAAGVEVYESAPAPIPREQIRRLLRVGDVFAARFVVEATLDESGQRRAQPALDQALASAQLAAGQFMVRV